MRARICSRRGVRLAGPRRSLDRQIRVARGPGRAGRPLPGPSRPRSAAARLPRTRRPGGRRSSRAVAASSSPLRPSRTTREPRSRSRSACSRVPGGPPSTKADRQRPVVVPADLQDDHAVRVVERPRPTAPAGDRMSCAGVAGRELVLLRREREPPQDRSLHLPNDVPAGQQPSASGSFDQIGRRQRADVEVAPPGRLVLAPVPFQQVGQQGDRCLLGESARTVCHGHVGKQRRTDPGDLRILAVARGLRRPPAAADPPS